MDGPVGIFLIVILAVAVGFIPWAVIVRLWELVSSFRRRSQRRNLADNPEAESSLSPDAEPVRKEWEEQGISFDEWLNYSKPHFVDTGSTSSGYYEQFISYTPLRTPAQSRELPIVHTNPVSPSAVSGKAYKPYLVEAPTPKPHKPSYSPLIKRFLDEDIHLYHFTDAANLESVKRLGLLPRARLETNLLRVTYLSDDLSRSLDERYGLSDFIHLSFHPEHSMLKAAQYRTSGRVMVLAVSLKVLDRKGCCFTRALANANGAVRIPVDEISDSDFRQLESGSYESRKWQLLVPGPIPWQLLRVEATHQGLAPLWH